MAVIEFNPIPDGRQVVQDAKTGHVEITVPYDAFTSSDLDSAVDVLGYAGVPAVYTADAEYPYAVVVRRQATQHPDDPRKWTVTLTYSSDYGDPDQLEEDPLERPAQITVESIEVQKPFERTVPLEGEEESDTVAVLTSARGTFETVPTYPDWYLRITVVKNFFNRGDDDVAPFRRSVNSAAFLGHPPYCVRLAAFRSAKQVDKTHGEYWQRTYVFEVLDPADIPPGVAVKAGVSPWDFFPLDQDVCTYDRPPLANVGRNPIFRFGRPVTRPVLLNGEGQEADVDAGNLPIPTYLWYARMRRKDYADLNLGV